MRAGVVAAALAIAAAAFASAIPGGFVADDDVQIVGNPFVRDPGSLGPALVSDVWGFARETGEPASGYWRPVFVLWLILNHAVFGFAPAGWHLASLALHGGVILLAAVVLRRSAIAPGVAAAVLWTFAAHPVHVEAVAWASGAPDLLLACFVLASYAAHLADRERPARATKFAAYALFGAALLSKESAILYPFFLAADEWTRYEGPTPVRRRLLVTVRSAFPYVVIVALVLAGRGLVLKSLAGAAPRRMDVATWMLTLPEAIVHYLKQMVWPATLAPVYPLHATAAAALLVALSVGAAAIAWRRGIGAYRLGISLFVVFLAPVLVGIPAFEPSRLVQDRYLYLPSLGFLLVAFQALADLGRRFLAPRFVEHAIRTLGALLAVVLAVLTARYNPLWRDDVALWERAAQVDPSAETLGTLGFHYRVAGRDDDARVVLERALRIDPVAAQPLLDLGILAADAGEFRRAERLLRDALAAAPAHPTIPDHLGRVLISRGRHDEAIEVFANARRLHPERRLECTVNLAVAERAAGRPARAAAELEAVRRDLGRRSNPGLLLGLWLLGETYLDLGRPDDARAAFAEFLDRTTGITDPRIEHHRTLATHRL